MQFVCRNFGLWDLPRRGLTQQEVPLEVLLLDIEAEMSIWEDGRPVWSEEAFPVAELAHHLALWLHSPNVGRQDFQLDYRSRLHSEALTDSSDWWGDHAMTGLIRGRNHPGRRRSPG